MARPFCVADDRGMTTRNRATTSQLVEPTEPAAEPTDATEPAAEPARASKGQIVFVAIDPQLNNGDDHAPAIVTRAWDNGLVNVRVIPDSNKIPEWRTSVKLHAERPDEPGHDAWWPPRA